MTGVHLTVLISTAATLAVVVEMLRRRQIREKYAVVWMAVSLPMIVFAISPNLFNRLARAVGVINPPDLLTVLACLFLLVVCVYMSWELGRIEERTHRLAEEVALLRSELTDRS
jgi:hypothetical protein